MDRIAIFGGTFNPVHNGHINLCNECQSIYHFDRVILIPTNLPPHKNAFDLASNRDRYHMLKLAVIGIKEFEVSDIEFQLGEKSYTINTILELEKKYPNAKLYLIVGSDMLKSFDKWYQYKGILEKVTLIVGARHDAEYNELLNIKKQFGSYSKKIDVINISVIDISSTDIREKLSQNLKISELVNHRVEDYIKKNYLYSKR